MKKQTLELKYTGKKQPPPDQYGQKGLYPYLPSDELIDAVNLTIFLNRPLLIKGDPGSGKTRLARAVAYELNLEYIPWHIKSTSQARDGRYTFDGVLRLRDAQLASIDENIRARVEDMNEYINYGPLGHAFKNKKRTIVLIDEIDKADIDFPNDLLLELDEQKFEVVETGEIVKAIEPPIIFITSNDEKDLPDAFLRRCLFFYIEFPGKDKLIEIINAHFQSQSPQQKVVEAAVERFMQLRQKMEKRKGKAGKKVSTSELLDWFHVLASLPEDRALKKLQGRLPYPEVLLKSWEDHLRYLQETVKENET